MTEEAGVLRLPTKSSYVGVITNKKEWQKIKSRIEKKEKDSKKE